MILKAAKFLSYRKVPSIASIKSLHSHSSSHRHQMLRTVTSANSSDHYDSKSQTVLMAAAASMFAFTAAGTSYSVNNNNNNNNNNNITTTSTETETETKSLFSDFVGRGPRRVTACEGHQPVVINGPADEVEDEEYDHLPVYKLEEIAKHDGKQLETIWMVYGGQVYDVTDFVANHPGGSDKILLAAGGSVEPFWNIYRQHFESDLPLKILEPRIIGNLDPEDDEKLMEEALKRAEDDPYAMEPSRHPKLIVHGETPMNAETPSDILLDDYITPNELFYVRHHHPVPYVSKDDLENYHLTVDLTAYGKGKVKISLEDIKRLPKHDVVMTLQCGGNRRGGFNEKERTSGTSWFQGAISTAKWSGAKMRDVLKIAGLNSDDVENCFARGLEHVRFESLDGMKVSVDLDKVTSLNGDCLFAYEMNDQPLPRDHGFPLRCIIPGYVAVRNAKWVQSVELSSEEAEGSWQRGLNYKSLPPNVRSVKEVDLSKIPTIQQSSVYSGITKVLVKESLKSDEVVVEAQGWAWAGGGRNIVRVDITGDGGKTWTPGQIYLGHDQKPNKGWAWTFWRCTLPVKVNEDGHYEVCSKAVDLAFNVQPQEADWNVRGLNNNGWFRMKGKISKTS